MPLPLPNLDDRTYADLVEEARGLIPTYAQDWTNHNPSDPGITLIELFAYLTEMLLYRLNRVTDANMLAFLKLLNGPGWAPSNQQSLADAVRDTILALRQPDRAITCEDFERLARVADPAVQRARCLSRRDLESGNSLTDSPGHVSVIIVPGGEELTPMPNKDLILKIKNDLEPRRLLATRLHVVGPRYVIIGVRITLALKSDALEPTVRVSAVESLQEFLHPLVGGLDRRGWPFGRSVYVSEVYDRLARLPGVDYVEKTTTNGQSLDELTVDIDPEARLKRNDLGELVAVELQADELVDARIDAANITIQPAAFSLSQFYAPLNP
jgi:hypothetical protein